MFQIAFCDDELATLNTLRVLLDQYRVERNQEIAYTAFQNPLELLAQIEKGTSYDILFLDILMPGQTGLQAAAEIWAQDTNVKIIFLTSSAEFAVQSYTVDAYFYQLKPIWKESFFRLMDSVLAGEKIKSSALIFSPANTKDSVLITSVAACVTVTSSERSSFSAAIRQVISFVMLARLYCFDAFFCHRTSSVVAQ